MAWFSHLKGDDLMEKFYLVYCDVPGLPTIIEHHWTRLEAEYLKQEIVLYTNVHPSHVIVQPVWRKVKRY